MRIFTKKSFAFINPDAGSLVDMKDATAAEVKTQPGGFHTVPDWVVRDQMFKWGVADGDITVMEEPKSVAVGFTTPESTPAEDPYKDFTNKQLYELCVEKEIEVEAKQPRAYYIEKLTSAAE